MRWGPGGEPGKPPGSQRATDRQGGQGASAMLLRLREADVVRLCGLRAAAQGLEYVSRHAVTQPRRNGARLLATVLAAPDDATLAAQAAPTPCETWCEALETPPAPLAIRWGCARDAVTSPAPGTPGCAHVAALLTAWVRTPGEFRALADEADLASASGQPPYAPRPLPQSPASPADATPADGELATTTERGVTRLTLADELQRLPTADAQALARRLIGVVHVVTVVNAANGAASTDAAHMAPGSAPAAAPAATSIGEPPADAILTLEPSPTEMEARAQAAAILGDPQQLARVVARMDPDAQSLLNDVLLLGGAITAADLHAQAERAGRASAATQNAMSALERFGLVFRVVRLAPSTVSATSRDGQRAPHDMRQAWRRVTGWRIAPEVRAALPIQLTPPADEARLRLASRARRLRASPRPLCVGLALLARAPAPLGPFGAIPDEASVPTGKAPAGLVGAGQANAGQEPHGGQTHPEPMRVGASAALTPGDLPPARLSELARGAGLPPGLLRMARRVLLWAREQAPGQPLTDLASAPAGERALALRAGFRLWRAAESAADLVDLEAPNSLVRMRYDLRSPAFRPAALAAEAAEARAFVVALLAHAEPGAWHTFDDLFALVWRVNPLFLRGRQQAYTVPAWRLERAADGRPLRPTVRDEWLAGEGAYLRALLTGPLHWWGAVDLLEAAPASSPAQPIPSAQAPTPGTPALAQPAPARPAPPPPQPVAASRAIAFRLTDLGAYLIADEMGDGRASTPGTAFAGQSPQSMTVGRQPQGAPLAPTPTVGARRMWAARGAKAATEALAGDWGAPLLLTGAGALAAHPLAASASQLNALGAWARVTGVAGGRLIYTLSADLACAAFDRDQTPTDAVASIQATGREADRVLAQLQRWRAAYGDARIEAGWALLEARDEVALREALAYAPAIAARVRLLAPTLALVHPADLAALRATLARKGYVV